METNKYKVPTNAVKIPDGDKGYSTVKKSYHRFLWTWNDAPKNQDDDYDEDLAESENIEGGLSSGKTAQDLADEHEVPLEVIQSQLYKGIKVEMEHTGDINIAEEIAMDHLSENPYYYDMLSKAEAGEGIDGQEEATDDVEESGEVDLGEVSGMGRSDDMPGGTVGYKSGPLSKGNVLPTDWYVDPDDKKAEEHKMKNLKHFKNFF